MLMLLLKYNKLLNFLPHFSEKIERFEKVIIFGYMPRDLTPKERRFCDEYLISFNGTQAAIKAGYSKKTARNIANQNLAKLHIQQYLSVRKKKMADKLELSQERVMQEIARIALFDFRKLFNENGSLKAIADMDDEAAAVLASVDVEELFEYVDKEKNHIGFTKKLKTWNKVQALEMLAKHYKIFEDAPPAPVININGLSASDLNTLLSLKKKMAG